MLRNVIPLILFSTLTWHVSAQTDTRIVTRPWETNNHWAETDDLPLYQFGGETRSNDDDLSIFYWDSSGRVKLDRNNNEPGYAFGYRFLTMTLDETSSSLVQDYNDLAIVFGWDFGEVIEGWRLVAVGGAGTANDGHWSNTHAIYGVGAIQLSHQLDENTTLNLGIDYQGNRAFLPDAPMPLVSYDTVICENLSIALGFPRGGVHWTPIDKLDVRFTYDVVMAVKFDVQYEVIEHVAVFGNVGRDIAPFTLDGGNTRLFYERNYISAGVAVLFEPELLLRFGAGYAFEQKFRQGYDYFDSGVVESATNAPFLFVRVGGTF